VTVGRVSDDIADAARVNGFKPDAFAPFLQRVPRLLNPDERITYDGLVAHGLDSITSRFLVRRNGQYQAVTYLYAQQAIDIDALNGLIRGVDPRLRLTGLPAINHELRQRFLPQFVKGLAIGVIAVALLIYVVFRSLPYTLLAMLPTLVGFIWSAGILGLLRIELDLFSLFAAITFIGIAVDYGIYVLHRFAIEGPRDVHQVLTRTGAAIMIACSTALVGFGTLINSSYSPLRVFGIVSVVTLTCCLLASIVFLPALIIQAQRWSRSAR
jgi:predicted RND superfamily exporter protein